MKKSTAFVSTHDLCKTFLMGRTRVHALAGVGLSIPEKSFTIIMGPSGSGKSTLLYLLGGLDRPTSGGIRVAGQSVDTLDENALAIYRQGMVGFIFQSFNLIAMLTAQENVEFPMLFNRTPVETRKKRSLELLRQVGLDKRTHHHPTELSGGQQQRVAIARALVNNPPLILADEPTGNLDRSSGFGIMQVLSDLHQQGHTVVVVTHDQRMERFATHSLFLLDGQTVTKKEYEAADLSGLAVEGAAA